MKILMLGNGGGINNGLPYNSFIIDGKHLCELPPDIMYSLHKNSIDITNITSIFVSHLHGDHFFGFPFLMLELFCSVESGEEKSVDLFAPEGAEEILMNLLKLSFGSNHPCIEWVVKNISFITVNEKCLTSFLPDYSIKFSFLEHSIETYGFSLYDAGTKLKFSYIADTLWCEIIEDILKENPEVVLIDLNGQENDTHKVHISLKDLQKKALPVTGDKTIYYGTHLKEEFYSDNQYIKCAIAGDIIDI